MTEGPDSATQLDQSPAIYLRDLRKTYSKGREHTVAVDGLTTAGLEASLAAVGGVYPAAGGKTTFDGFATTSSESSAATITIAHSGALNLVDTDSCAAVIVEVCYFLSADGPDSDDLSLPYKTEAGQGY